MAFQQQQARPQPQRFAAVPQQPEVPQSKASPRKRTLEESEEWILFSPQADSASRTATSQTPRTATQLSEFGSLETHHRSQLRRGSHDEAQTELDDENEELDSLDDGLHAFQHHPFSTSSLNQLDQSGGTVLPTHDGLGTFSAPGMQNQMWQFEKYNPHRRKGMVRKSSLQQRIDEVGDVLEVDGEDERTTRIEQWRIEQSRAVLEEIERETRRRRRKLNRLGTRSEHSTSVMESSIGDISTPAMATPQPVAAEPSESWWARITRRVIREIIGIDDTTLSVLFGQPVFDASPTPTQASPIAEAAATESRVTFNDPNSTWELRLLERIARELGILVSSLSHEHEGAFSTYATTSENTLSLPTRDFAPRQPSLRQRQRLLAQATSSDITFSPTLAPGPLTPSTEADTSLWGIEEEREEAPATNTRTEQQHWERDIDLPSVFAYLRNHFSASAPQPTQEESGPLPAAWATDGPSLVSALGTSPESLARAESIRRQHPLVNRAAERAAAQHRRRESLLRRHQMQALLQKAKGSSCASHSTKRSRRTLSGSSSRHYWDIGGSAVDSEAAFSANGAGAWGEV